MLPNMMFNIRGERDELIYEHNRDEIVHTLFIIKRIKDRLVKSKVSVPAGRQRPCLGRTT